VLATPEPELLELLPELPLPTKGRENSKVLVKPVETLRAPQSGVATPEPEVPELPELLPELPPPPPKLPAATKDRKNSKLEPAQALSAPLSASPRVPPPRVPPPRVLPPRVLPPSAPPPRVPPPRVPPSTAPSLIAKVTMNKRKWQRRTGLVKRRMLSLRFRNQRKKTRKRMRKRMRKRHKEGEGERPPFLPSSPRMFHLLNPSSTQHNRMIAASSYPMSYGSTSTGLPTQQTTTIAARDRLLVVSVQPGVGEEILSDVRASPQRPRVLPVVLGLEGVLGAIERILRPLEKALRHRGIFPGGFSSFFSTAGYLKCWRRTPTHMLALEAQGIGLLKDGERPLQPS
jgi:hypothetical protein